MRNLACVFLVLIGWCAPTSAGEALLDAALDRGDAEARFTALCNELKADPADARVTLFI